MDDIMSREETRELFKDIKGDFRDFSARMEAKIDVATENINKYAKDTIEHNVRIGNIEKDVDSIGAKARFNQKAIWTATGGLTTLVFVLKYAS